MNYLGASDVVFPPASLVPPLGTGEPWLFPRELGLFTFSPTLRLDVAALTEPTFQVTARHTGSSERN